MALTIGADTPVPERTVTLVWAVAAKVGIAYATAMIATSKIAINNFALFIVIS
jgi:hypothetical protein